MDSLLKVLPLLPVMKEPGDRLGIPFVNGFGRKLLVKFVDRSSETGLKIEDGEVQLSFQGDKQYAYFPISGTPTQDGSVPISFDIFENGEKIGTTITKTIPIWAEGTQRPAREFIPTSEKPFVLLGGEINWVNQSAPITGAQKRTNILVCPNVQSLHRNQNCRTYIQLRC